MPTDNPSAGGGGNILTRKLGPLPGWAWAVVGVGGVLVLRKFGSGLGSAGAATSPAAAPAATDTTGQGSSPYGPPGLYPDTGTGLGAASGYGPDTGGDPTVGGLQPADGSTITHPANVAGSASSASSTAARTTAKASPRVVSGATMAKRRANKASLAAAARKATPTRHVLPKPATHKPAPAAKLDRHQAHEAAVARHPARYAKPRKAPTVRRKGSR